MDRGRSGMRRVTARYCLRLRTGPGGVGPTQGPADYRRTGATFARRPEGKGFLVRYGLGHGPGPRDPPPGAVPESSSRRVPGLRPVDRAEPGPQSRRPGRGRLRRVCRAPIRLPHLLPLHGHHAGQLAERRPLPQGRADRVRRGQWKASIEILSAPGRSGLRGPPGWCCGRTRPSLQAAGNAPANEAGASVLANCLLRVGCVKSSLSRILRTRPQVCAARPPVCDHKEWRFPE